MNLPTAICDVLFIALLIILGSLHEIGSKCMGRNYFESYLYWWLPYARLNLRSSSLSLTLAVFSVWIFAEHRCALLMKHLLVTVPLSLYDRLPFVSGGTGPCLHKYFIPFRAVTISCSISV
jgi:hypothetical protein